MDIVVGVSDMKISNNPQARIVTYSLGSCIGITIYDPFVKVGGLLHFQLPDSGLNVHDAQRDPCKYADTAIPAFFRTAYRFGAKKQRLKVVVTGGANLMDENSHFDIGQRNYLRMSGGATIERSGLTWKAAPLRSPGPGAAARCRYNPRAAGGERRAPNGTGATYQKRSKVYVRIEQRHGNFQVAAKDQLPGVQ